MLTLKDFELQLNETILRRGKQYYADGALTGLEETGKSIWHAKVVGSTTYTVEIKLLDKIEIEDYSCNCPYNEGICKHIAAVLFRLKEVLINTRAAQPEKPDFKTLFQKISLKEIAELVQQNMDIVEIRQGAVDSAIDKKDFSLAKKLIAEGIKIARQKGHPGVVSEWEKELLRVASLEEDRETIRHYTKYFAFHRWFNRDYYIQWRKTFTAAEWKKVIEKHIAEKINQIEEQYQKNKGKVWYSPDVLLLDALAPIYVEEEYWDRLLALVSKDVDLDRILQYHNYLVKEYPSELLAIYLPAFERKGDTAGNRGEYANLAGKMKTVIKSIPEGKEKIIAVAKNLNQKYPRRPAMVQELNKIIAMDKG